MSTTLTLHVLPDVLAVCRLAPQDPVPPWANGPGFCSITRTADELSIVCHSDRVPLGTVHNQPFRALAVQGPLDFGLTGILARLAIALADAGIPIFAIATYDTDYILINQQHLQQAIDALRGIDCQVKT